MEEAGRKSAVCDVGAKGTVFLSAWCCCRWGSLSLLKMLKGEAVELGGTILKQTRINDVANCLKRNEGSRVQILAGGETLFPSETGEARQ